MQYTTLKPKDLLPLTCTRAGICCFGNQVLLNPWELACLANEKKLSVSEFKDNFTEWSGLRLKFNGEVGYNGKKACNLYVNGMGCSIHNARPLACRLFPLGRQIQNNQTIYMYQGNELPCLDGCNEVLNLTYCSVEDYLIEQKTAKWEEAQKAYLEIAQHLADIAFEFILDSRLIASGDKETLQQWRLLANESTEQLAERIGQKWLDILFLPHLNSNIQQPQFFCEQHFGILQEQLFDSFGNAQSIVEIHNAAVLLMAMALLLSISVGASSQSLIYHWIYIAKDNGAHE